MLRQTGFDGTLVSFGFTEDSHLGQVPSATFAVDLVGAVVRLHKMGRRRRPLLTGIRCLAVSGLVIERLSIPPRLTGDEETRGRTVTHRRL